MPPMRRQYVRRRKLRLPMNPRLAVQRYRRIRRSAIPHVYTFTEKAQLASIGVPAGATNGGRIGYTLTDLGNFGSYRNLFDLYKLTGVKLTLIPLVSQSDTASGNFVAGQTGAAPMLYVAPNRDPYVPSPTGISDILNDDGVKIMRFLKPVSFYIKSPKPALTSGDGTQTLPIQLNVGKDFWLTTGGNGQTVDQSNIPHYGHRFVITNNAQQEIVVQAYVKYYFQMKEQD